MWMGLTSLPLWIEDTLTDALIWEERRIRPGPNGADLTDEEERQFLNILAENTRLPIVELPQGQPGATSRSWSSS